MIPHLRILRLILLIILWVLPTYLWFWSQTHSKMIEYNTMFIALSRGKLYSGKIWISDPALAGLNINTVPISPTDPDPFHPPFFTLGEYDFAGFSYFDGSALFRGSFWSVPHYIGIPLWFFPASLTTLWGIAIHRKNRPRKPTSAFPVDNPHPT